MKNINGIQITNDVKRPTRTKKATKKVVKPVKPTGKRISSGKKRKCQFVAINRNPEGYKEQERVMRNLVIAGVEVQQSTAINMGRCENKHQYALTN